MRKIYPLILLLGLSFTSQSQTVDSGAETPLTDEEVQELVNLSFEMEGTYQIQMIDTRETPAISLKIFPTLYDLRHETEIVYHTVNEKMRIMILPYATINAPEFEWIDRIAYVNSTDPMP